MDKAMVTKHNWSLNVRGMIVDDIVSVERNEEYSLLIVLCVCPGLMLWSCGYARFSFEQEKKRRYLE
jgi:hypothetical protein